jgi:hypothetical protein
MKRVIVPISSHQQDLIRLVIAAIDPGNSKNVIRAWDETDAVEVDLRQLNPDADPDQFAMALGLLAVGALKEMKK